MSSYQVWFEDKSNNSMYPSHGNTAKIILFYQAYLMTVDVNNIDNLRTLGDFVRWFESTMRASDLSYGQGFINPFDEAVYLVLNTLDLGVELRPDYWSCNLTPPECQKLQGILHQRIIEKVPSAYITGEAWFAGLPFIVDPSVLIPRSPFAELVKNGFEPWLEFEPDTILELCTGSGCIAIAAAEEFPFADLLASDISVDALAIAQQNVDRYEINDRLSLIESDLFENIEGTFDLIITNPPYVPVSEVDALADEFHKEPRLGLDSGDDGMDIPLRIMAESADYLSPNGLLFLEVGYTRRTMEEMLPQLQSVWITFENGGDGVVVCSRDELLAIKPVVLDLLQQRKIHVG